MTTDNEELRCYTFTLAQLNTMQQGIQAAHAAVEMAMKAYTEQMVLRTGTKWTTCRIWATQWKTLIMLNGGDALALRGLEDFFLDPQNTYPWASFHEDDSFYGALTSVAIVLPERIFNMAEDIRRSKESYIGPLLENFTLWERELIERLAASRRAV